MTGEEAAAERMAAFLYGYDGEEEFVPWDSLASDHPVRRARIQRAKAALMDGFEPIGTTRWIDTPDGEYLAIVDEGGYSIDGAAGMEVFRRA